MTASGLDVSFAHFLPPIFRVVLMTALCILGFAMDLQVLQYWDMNIFLGAGPTLLPSVSVGRTSSRAMAANSGAMALYLLALCHVAWATFCWLMYRFHVDASTGARTMYSQAWEVATLAGLLALWMIPGPFRRMLRTWNRTLVRLLTPSLRVSVSFTDVVAADILTSFAKVLGDVWISLVVLTCFLLGRRADDSVLLRAEMSIAVPMLISVPYLIRLRQCLCEYVVSSQRPRRPLYNALKYLSSLPVIWLRVTPTLLHASPALSRMFNWIWYVCVLVNTLFSFWWDVTNDWGLDLLQIHSFRAMVAEPRAHLPVLHRRSSVIDTDLTSSAPPSSDFRSPVSGDTTGDTGTDGKAFVRRHTRRASLLRRPEKPLPLPTTVYWVFLVVNLFLRFTWSLKLSSHWQFLVEWQRGLLLLEALEIVRRSVWVLLRVEWELVRQSPSELWGL